MEAPFGQDRWLVRMNDGVQNSIQLVASRAAQLLESRHELFVLCGSVLEQIVGAFALELEIRPLQQEREAVPDELEIPGIQLLLLDENLLSHADLAEVVQEAGVAQLAKLLACEREPAIRADSATAHRLGQAHGERRDPAGVTGSCRVSLFDGRYRRGHEAFEESLDVLVE